MVLDKYFIKWPKSSLWFVLGEERGPESLRLCLQVNGTGLAAMAVSVESTLEGEVLEHVIQKEGNHVSDMIDLRES